MESTINVDIYFSFVSLLHYFLLKDFSSFFFSLSFRLSQYIWHFTSIRYFEFDQNLRGERCVDGMRRTHAANSHLRDLVSSQWYLSLERAAGCGTLILYRLPVISFSRFLSSSSSILTFLPACYDKRCGEKKNRTHRKSRKPRNCLFGGKSETDQADAQKAIIRALSSLIRFRGRLYPGD